MFGRDSDSGCSTDGGCQRPLLGEGGSVPFARSPNAVLASWLAVRHEVGLVALGTFRLPEQCYAAPASSLSMRGTNQT